MEQDGQGNDFAGENSQKRHQVTWEQLERTQDRILAGEAPDQVFAELREVLLQPQPKRARKEGSEDEEPAV